MNKEVHIIGAGPGGLFASYLLLKEGLKVHLYEQNSGVGKKLLIAGKSGLNITHSTDINKFHKKYYKNQDLFKSLISEFSPQDALEWMNSLGIEHFIGSSGKVFPIKFKAGDLLNKWMKKLNDNSNFNLYLNHKLISVNDKKELVFESNANEIRVNARNVVFSLGGASWKSTGSDGKWQNTFDKLGIKCERFEPMNCGFNITWSELFKEKVAGYPLKNINIKFGEKIFTNEILITDYGVEGNGIYQVSKEVREEINSREKAIIKLDLKPHLTQSDIIKELKGKRKSESLSSFFKKRFKFDKEMTLLFYEVADKERLDSTEYIASLIKNIPLKLESIQSIDKAISTSGGVRFNELNQDLELIKIPGVYIIGEMLDFEAPTGGFLLQGVFSTAFRAAKAISSKHS